MTPDDIEALLAEPRLTAFSEAEEGEILGMIHQLQNKLTPEEFRDLALKLARQDEKFLRDHLPADAPVIRLLDEDRP